MKNLLKKAMFFLIFSMLLTMVSSTSLEAAGKKTKLSNSNITLKVGKKKTITLKNYKKISKKKIKKVKWTTSNKKVVAIKVTGKYRQKCVITGKKKGTATIKVKYNGKTYKCRVKVNKGTNAKSSAEGDNTTTEDKKTTQDEKTTEDKTVLVSSILLSSDFESMTVGDTIKLTASVLPSNATDKSIEWSSTKPDLASVDKNGNVKALKAGKVAIYAKNTKSKKKASVNIIIGNPAKYSYECFILGNIYSGYFYPHDVYGCGNTIVYIKTNNPDPSTISLRYKNVIFNSMSNAPFLISSTTKFDDVEYLEFDSNEYSDLRAVEGGYIGITNYNVDIPVGNQIVQVREYYNTNLDIEYSDPVYTVAKEFNVTVHDYDAEFNEWMDNVIAQTTDDTMNVHEKMNAICTYLKSQFRYLPSTSDDNGNIKILSLASEMGPSFKAYVWESYISPATLVKFGEKIGYKLTNMYFEGDWSKHAYAKGIFEGNTYYYEACPLLSTNYYEDVNTIKKVDFSKY